MPDREKNAVALPLLLCTVSLYLLCWQTLSARAELPVYYYGRLMELLGVGLFIALALTTPMRFDEMGIVTDRRTLLCSLALGGGIALTVLGGCAVLGTLRGSDPFFSFRFREDFSQVTYAFVVPVQEILAKSVMYYSFEMVLGEEHPVLVVGLTALVFGIFHVVYGFSMMLLAMALSVLTGWMFRRVRCVWGCALAHFACGFFPVCFGF